MNAASSLQLGEVAVQRSEEEIWGHRGVGPEDVD